MHAVYRYRAEIANLSASRLIGQFSQNGSTYISRIGSALGCFIPDLSKTAGRFPSCAIFFDSFVVIRHNALNNRAHIGLFRLKELVFLSNMLRICIAGTMIAKMSFAARDDIFLLVIIVINL